MDFTLDIYLHIFNYLDPKDIFVLLAVSSKFNMVLENITKKRCLSINLARSKITDAGLSHLKGVHTINLKGCKKII
jgi:hypothetical protein